MYMAYVYKKNCITLSELVLWLFYQAMRNSQISNYDSQNLIFNFNIKTQNLLFLLFYYRYFWKDPYLGYYQQGAHFEVWIFIAGWTNQRYCVVWRQQENCSMWWRQWIVSYLHLSPLPSIFLGIISLNILLKRRLYNITYQQGVS